jgi:hypothetical protein
MTYRLLVPLFLAGVALLAGCASQSTMQHYVPASCHGATETFSTFAIEQVNMPGFIQGVIDESVSGALLRLGLKPSESADLNVRVSFELIDRNAPPREKDPFGEPVATSQINRFVIHVDLDIFDNRSSKLIWTGSMNRAHAIEGGETFHSDRAVLTISDTLDTMFEGLTTPCE